MLAGNFFDIQSLTVSESEDAHTKFSVVAHLNSNHPIYHGHFPGNPVVPGVCQVQMVKEIIEKAVKHSLTLREADNIKFLSMINPQVNSQLTIILVIKTVSNRQFSVTASIGSGTSLFFKFKGKFESSGDCLQD